MNTLALLLLYHTIDFLSIPFLIFFKNVMLKASCRDKKYCRISLPIHNAIVFSKRQCKKDPIGDVALGTDKSILIIIGSKGFVNGKFEVL